jgi:hypothetical protein
MRGLRSVIALIVVLAGLYAYIYFVTSKKPEGDTGPKQDKVFTSVEADKIDDLRIKSSRATRRRSRRATRAGSSSSRRRPAPTNPR